MIKLNSGRMQFLEEKHKSSSNQTTKSHFSQGRRFPFEKPFKPWLGQNQNSQASQRELLHKKRTQEEKSLPRAPLLRRKLERGPRTVVFKEVGNRCREMYQKQISVIKARKVFEE